MKFSIAARLFFAVLLTSLLVAAGGLGMLRATTERAFARYVAEIELSRMDGQVTELIAVYKENAGWPAIPDERRSAWLRHHFQQLAWKNSMPPGDMGPPGGMPPPDERGSGPFDDRHAPPGGEGPPPPPGGFGDHAHGPFHPDRLQLLDRSGLIDATGNYIAGAMAAPEDPRRSITVDGKVVGYMTLLRTLDPHDDISREFLSDQTRNLLLIAAFCIALSALAAGLLAAHFRKPIHLLGQAAEDLARGDFSTRLELNRSDELGALGQNVNQLAHMLEQHESSRRQWVADTSHELRTPVSVLRMQIEAVLDGVRKAEPPLFTAMHRQIAMLGKLIEDLYLLAQADVNQLHCENIEINPWEIVQAEADAFRARITNANLLLRMDTSDPQVQLACDPTRLQQIIGNLLQNSLRYTDPGGVVSLSTRLTETEWILQVDDSTPGVPDAALARLGERFFRVEQSRSRLHGGSGLGLALCQRIADALGGQLQFSHSMLDGLQASLHLPLRRNS